VAGVDDVVELGGDLVTQASRLLRVVRRENALPASARVLSLLDQLGPCGVTALATADRCSQPTMSTAVKELVGRGLASRTPDPADSRSQLVEISAEGRADLARLRRASGELVARRLARTDHTPEDLATAVGVLRDLLEEGRP
jgi:DNA-binding MarR family transcriptional regulator